MDKIGMQQAGYAAHLRKTGLLGAFPHPTVLGVTDYYYVTLRQRGAHDSCAFDDLFDCGHVTIVDNSTHRITLVNGMLPYMLRRLTFRSSGDRYQNNNTAIFWEVAHWGTAQEAQCFAPYPKVVYFEQNAHFMLATHGDSPYSANHQDLQFARAKNWLRDYVARDLRMKPWLIKLFEQVLSTPALEQVLRVLWEKAQEQRYPEQHRLHEN